MLNKDVINPVITTILIGALAWGYDKVQEKTTKFNELVENHPEVVKDLEDLRKVKEEMMSEYKAQKAKTNYRLDRLESAKKVDLKPIYRALKRDSLDRVKIHNRLEYLKDLL